VSSVPTAIAPRLDRADAGLTVAQAASGAGGGSFPRARIWSWYIDAALGQRTTRVSPAFNGPALILELMFRYPQANNIRNWALFWSNDDGGTLTGGATTIRPSGTPIFEQHTFESASGGNDIDEIAESFVSVGTAGDPTAPVVLRPRYIINTSDRFFLKVTVGGGSAGGGTYRGSVTIVEGNSLDDLRNFW
jgi:hypothetical protein